jgi:hypothetical protein
MLLPLQLFRSCCFCCLGDDAPVPGEGTKPVFTERPVTKQSDDDLNDIVIECRLVGEPEPTISW